MRYVTPNSVDISSNDAPESSSTSPLVLMYKFTYMVGFVGYIETRMSDAGNKKLGNFNRFIAGIPELLLSIPL